MSAPSVDAMRNWFREARDGRLSLDSPHWACVAPDSIGDDFILYMQKGETIAHALARQGKLPAAFAQLEIREGSRTLAHLLATLNKLPAGFSHWTWRDDLERTVAHEAARFGGLPRECDCLDLADHRGRTVAHELARKGTLPADFTGWEWAAKNGETVVDVARKWRREDLLAQYEAWRLRQELCRLTDASVMTTPRISRGSRS